MAAGQEIKGSRKETSNGKISTGIELWISDDGTSGPIPTAGGLYAPDAALGIKARRCVTVTDEPEVVPGIHYHVAKYVGFTAYS